MSVVLVNIFIILIIIVYHFPVKFYNSFPKGSAHSMLTLSLYPVLAIVTLTFFFLHFLLFLWMLGKSPRLQFFCSQHLTVGNYLVKKLII